MQLTLQSIHSQVKVWYSTVTGLNKNNFVSTKLFESNYSNKGYTQQPCYFNHFNISLGES